MVGSELRHMFKAVEGIRMHYVTAGQKGKPAVVLLAGFPQSWYAWRKVIPYLSQSYQVFAIDLPGQGDSDKPGDGYDTQTIANRVHGVVKGLGLSRYSLAAHDIGAWVAFPYAAMFGNEVERLAMLDAGIPGVTLPDMLPSDPDRAWRTWHFPFHAVPDLPELLIRDKERTYLEWFLRRKTANPTIFTEADLDEYERIFTQPGSLRAGLAYYRACAKSAEQNRALVKNDPLNMDVLAVSADQGSIPNMAKPLEVFAPKVEGVTINECGHYIPEEQPLKLAGHLRAFFSPEVRNPFDFEK
ncbi:LANO_0D00342g1_1 [Lachancea nothofagi CBS 11611]|uniref:LANO_0D00342g1_1 n=1 Tax=Lachancea nothofagi CBS 11611 TaxID=1266666 RepID=A0A1G4JCM6_9SACH|nr:LANO_0D00342g1_1 [Lachancea nothofagi CBS 11611]